jgi:hypothetical protein
VNLPILAQELLHKTLWYPTILGILVVVFAIGLFCGSVYLLLSTNLGARLGFLVAFTALAGFMVLLTSLWVTTTSPLNTLKGRIPQWRPVQEVSNLSQISNSTVRDFKHTGKKVSAIEAANVKAAADANLILPPSGVVPQAKTAVIGKPDKYGKFMVVTDYKAVNTYEVGGSHPNPLNFELTHKPLYAVVQYCAVQTPDPLKYPFGTKPPTPVCDKTSKNSGFLVLKRDLGSLRIPPIVAWISSVLLFGLGLLGLHWRERDEQEAAKRTSTELVPANA